MAACSITFLALAALTLAVTASGGEAAGPARTPILGVVPHASPLALAPQALGRDSLTRAVGAAAPKTLTFDASYETDINRYFTDVAAASGRTDNVYSVATQYTDNSGPIQYQSKFGGSYVDRSPLPANGCKDGVDKYCLTDAQLQDEIQKVLTTEGWHGGLDHIFVLMTPNGVGSCLVSGECSTNAFCAYHRAFTDSNNENVVYVNEPYEGPDPLGGCVDPTQGFPNDVDADTTINTISHEHNEAITDPLAPPLSNHAWIAADGSENGDLCIFGFGNALGGTPGVNAYNQVINGHHYDLQEEWSNAADNGAGGCVQRLGGPTSPQPPGDGSGPLLYDDGPVMHTNTTYAIYWLPTASKLPAATKAPHISGRARVGKRLSGSRGSWTYSPTAYRYQWLRCNAHGGSCSSIHSATRPTYTLVKRDAGHRLRLRITATNAAGSKKAVSSASARVAKR